VTSCPPLELGSRSCRPTDVARALRVVQLVVIVAGIAGLGACRTSDERLQEHQKKFESLGSTAAAIGEAWLGGSVSGTYTRTALERTFLLVEQERSALARTPETLTDSRAAHLSEAAERLSRVLALMAHDVKQRDTTALRRHLTQIPLYPRQQP
jgi:hypothetical protein